MTVLVPYHWSRDHQLHAGDVDACPICHRCPDCEWVEIRTFGDPEPTYQRGRPCNRHATTTEDHHG